MSKGVYNNLMNTIRILSLTIFMSLVIACGGTLDTTCTLPDGKIVEEGWLGTDPITNETQVCLWYCTGGTISAMSEECPPLTKTIAQTLETIEPEPDTNEKVKPKNFFEASGGTIQIKRPILKKE